MFVLYQEENIAIPSGRKDLRGRISALSYHTVKWVDVLDSIILDHRQDCITFTFQVSFNVDIIDSHQRSLRRNPTWDALLTWPAVIDGSHNNHG